MWVCRRGEDECVGDGERGHSYRVRRVCGLWEREQRYRVRRVCGCGGEGTKL